MKKLQRGDKLVIISRDNMGNEGWIIGRYDNKEECEEKCKYLNERENLLNTRRDRKYEYTIMSVKNANKKFKTRRAGLTM